MRFLRFLPYLFAGGLMMLHGFAHLPGVLGSWGIATFEDVSRQPNILLTNASDPVVWALGAVWLLAALSFVVAGVGVLRRSDWWPVAGVVAIVVSLPVTILWKDDAVIGLVLNGVLLAGLAVWYVMTPVRERSTA
jgi:hypothetical protein